MKFLRRNWSKASRLGKGRKKKQIWRSPKGRHSKMRNKRKGYPQIVEVGFRTDKKQRDLIENKKPVEVNNMKEMQKVKKGEIAIIGRIGEKKRLDLIKFAKEKGIEVGNVNLNKTLKKEKMKLQAKGEKKKWTWKVKKH